MVDYQKGPLAAPPFDAERIEFPMPDLDFWPVGISTR